MSRWKFVGQRHRDGYAIADAVRAAACTRESHAAAKADEATWQTWRLLGRQGDLELRDCPHCRSTLGKEVAP